MNYDLSGPPSTTTEISTVALTDDYETQTEDFSFIYDQTMDHAKGY